MSQDDSTNSIGRRGFLKSIFGLPAIAAQPEAPGVVPRTAPVFIWADLKTGQVGFPTGVSLGSGMPGSLMKIIASAALHEEGLLSPNQIYECPGHITIHGQTFNCLHAHGRVNLTHAIAKSCNVFFIKASEKLNTAVFLEYAKKFGLDQQVAGKNSGSFPAVGHGPSYNYVLGLAPDMLPNALQILRMAALVATQGHVPFLHSAEETGDGSPFELHLSEGTWHRLRQGMELACTEGTAMKLDPQHKMHIAAKTGTAPQGKSFSSWITGYFPADDPKHAFVLNSQAGTSQDAAVPKAHELLFATTWP